MTSKASIIANLQSEILRMEGFRPCDHTAVINGLESIRHVFPNKTFPLGCIHEFISTHAEDLAATNGFISGLLSTLMRKNAAALWISASRNIFPPSLKIFGIEPDQFIFIDVKNERDVLWTMHEALKCAAITAVVAEINDFTFTESRRMQLAVEQSKATGFVIRKSSKLTTTASVSRWKISQLASEPIDTLPGIGFPRWRVELLRMRNGKSGVWEFSWRNGGFAIAPHVSDKDIINDHQERSAG